jgi:hypothetical protein
MLLNPSHHLHTPILLMLRVTMLQNGVRQPQMSALPEIWFFRFSSW